jgi:hypothetical protein
MGETSNSSSTKKRLLSNEEALQLINRCQVESVNAMSVLSYARGVAERAGLTVDSAVVHKAYQCNTALLIHNANTASQPSGTIHHNASTPKHMGDVTTRTLTESARNQIDLYGRMRGGINCFPLILETTQGYSNTDHVVMCTGDGTFDRVAEYKRSLRRRARAMRPEDKGEQRWDQPRVKGSRRRRIKRNKDLASAPPEPPFSSYVLFLSQMTTKLRHDRGPQTKHNQMDAVAEISRSWKYDLTEMERDHYTRSVREMRKEYVHQLQEFRATGHYTPSIRFGKLLGHGPFVRLLWAEKNALEKELSTYQEIVRPGSIILRAEDYHHERNNQHNKDQIFFRDDVTNDEINITDECSIDFFPDGDDGCDNLDHGSGTDE